MKILASILLLSFPIHGNAEVMDKEFSMATVLLWGVIGTLLMYLAARYRPRLLTVLFPVFGSFFYLQLSEMLDPHVGPAIVNEAGKTYVFTSWAAAALVLIGGGIGYAARRRRSLASAVR